ncbi:hypothetical protein GCM10027414_08690 [Humibacter ginsengiterrae]
MCREIVTQARAVRENGESDAAAREYLGGGGDEVFGHPFGRRILVLLQTTKAKDALPSAVRPRCRPVRAEHDRGRSRRN